MVVPKASWFPGSLLMATPCGGRGGGEGAGGEPAPQRRKEEGDKGASVNHVGPALQEAIWEELSATKAEEDSCLAVWPAPCLWPGFILHEQWVENYSGSFPEGLGNLGPVHEGERFSTPQEWDQYFILKQKKSRKQLQAVTTWGCLRPPSQLPGTTPCGLGSGP